MSEEDVQDELEDHGAKLWAEVERLVETHLVPELEAGTFANYELFVQVGEDAEHAVTDRPLTDDETDRKLLEWAGNAFIYQMGFFRWPGEICCDVTCLDKTKRQLTDKQIYQLVIERMDAKGLKARVIADNTYKARPHRKVSTLLQSAHRRNRLRRDRSKSPKLN
jgi:hypothetical protein